MKIQWIMQNSSKILLTPVKILDRQLLPKTLSSISRLQLFAKFYFNNFFQATFSRKGFFFKLYFQVKILRISRVPRDLLFISNKFVVLGPL